jgi:hypothetical protein
VKPPLTPEVPSPPEVRLAQLDSRVGSVEGEPLEDNISDRAAGRIYVSEDGGLRVFNPGYLRTVL